MTRWSDLVFDAAPAEATKAQAPQRWSDDVFGVSAPSAEARKATLPEGAEPDANTWIGRRVQDIRGKRDPRFKDVPVYLPEPMTGGDAAMLYGKVFAGDDARYGDILAKSLGDRLVKREKDANGYEVITYVDDKGQQKQGYINKPGLDLEDVNRAAFGAAPYLAAGAGLGRFLGKTSAGPGVKSLIQGTGAAATSVGTDVAAMAAGSEQGVDPIRAGVIGAFGAAGEVATPGINYLVDRFIKVPGLFDKASGRLTDKGVAAAKQAGIDPAELTAEMAQVFAKTYARTGSPAVAGMKTRAGDIPVTQGQISKDPQQLLREKGMRIGVYGDEAKQIISKLDAQQKQAVTQTVTASGDPTKPGMIERLGGDDVSRFASLGNDIRSGVETAKSGAKAMESAAWDKVKGLTATPQAFAEMPRIMGNRLGQMRVDAGNTPVAFRMGQMLDDFASGVIPEQSAKMLGSVRPMTVDDMRRRLGPMVAEAANSPTDKAAAGAIYDGFNDWIAEAARKSLLDGDVAAAANLVTARDISREIGSVFRPRNAEMRPTAGGRMLQSIMSKGTPEEIVDALFTGQTRSQIKDGSAEALDLIKQGLDKYAPPETAKETWNALRIAYWLRIVQNKGGDINTPQAILTNLKNAFWAQRSIATRLYTPQEMREMSRILNQMEAITWKDPNPSGTATGVAMHAREFLQTLFDWAGGSRVIRTALGVADRTLGISNKFGGAQAAKAVSQRVPSQAPTRAGFGAASGATIERERIQRP